MRSLEWWEWAGLGVGAGVLYLVLRPTDSNAMTAPPTIDSGTPIHLTSDPPVEIHASAPPMPPPNAGPDAPRPNASATLVHRLRASEQARRIFAYQSLLWSWGFYNWSFGYSNTLPDGVITPGGPTEQKIRAINVMVNEPPSTAFTEMSMMKAVAALGLVSTNRNYLLPYKLPRDVIDAVNRTIAGMSVSLELQAIPA